MSKYTRQTGFTLLELLVALSIFALLAAMAYGGLNTVLKARQATDQQAQRLDHLQKAFFWLERDIEQTTDRAVRDDYGTPVAAMLGVDYGDYLLELTRSGWRNPTSLRSRSNLQRVAYGLRDEQLLRFYWNVLDRAQDSKPMEVMLLDKVQKLELRYLDAKGDWHDDWPPQGAGLDSRPRAVEVSLETEREGRISRLFRVPG